MESYCLMSIEFQFGMMDSGDGGTVKVTELYTENGLKWEIYVLYILPQ